MDISRKKYIEQQQFCWAIFYYYLSDLVQCLQIYHYKSEFKFKQQTEQQQKCCQKLQKEEKKPRFLPQLQQMRNSWVFIKMSQIFKFKQFYNNQMSHIQEFLSSNLPAYYLEVLSKSADKKEFLDYNNEANIFRTTVDLLMLAQGKTNNWAQGVEQIVKEHMWMSYQSLQQVHLPIKENDSAIMRLMKSQLSYVYNQMMQLLLRLLLAYFQSCQSQFLNNTIQTHIQQISYIYPALKTEVSFNFDSINLVQWFQKCLEAMANKKQFNSVFVQVLEKIKKQCCFIGPMDKLFSKFIQVKQSEDVKDYKMPLFTLKKTDTSSKIQQKPEQKTEKKKQSHNFNDFQAFRRKKKIIIKEKLRPCMSPIVNNDCKKGSPKTERTVDYKYSCDDQESSKASSPLLVRMMAKSKIPQTRTLYYGETKKFVCKKNMHTNFQIQNYQSSSSYMGCETIPLLYAVKRADQKLQNSNSLEHQTKGFCVPETPKPQNTNHLHSQKLSSSRQKTNSSLQRFKI